MTRKGIVHLCTREIKNEEGHQIIEEQQQEQTNQTGSFAGTR